MIDNQNLNGTLLNTSNQQFFTQDNKYEAVICLCLFLLLCVLLAGFAVEHFFTKATTRYS